MSDRIELRGIRAIGHHGVLPEERRDGQEFVVDVSLDVDLRAAAAGDDLAATVNYADLAQRVHDAVAADPVDLIETLAERVLRLCWDYAGVTAAEVSVHKPQAPIPVPFADVAVRLSRLRPRRVVFGLGANLDDPVGQLRAAARALAALPGATVRAASPIYITAPWGNTAQPPFRNAVLILETDRTADELLAAAQRIEAAAGRVRTEHWGPRVLDVDLIAVGAERRADPLLTLPHPRAAERAFVLLPWLAADPAAVLPGVGPVAALVERLGADGVERTDDELLPVGDRDD